MGEYICYYDRDDEPLIPIHTYSNSEQGWNGEELWNIQIHYKICILQKNKILKQVIQCAGMILEYETFKDRGLSDLYSTFSFFVTPFDFLTIINYNIYLIFQLHSIVPQYHLISLSILYFPYLIPDKLLLSKHLSVLYLLYESH